MLNELRPDVFFLPFRIIIESLTRFFPGPFKFLHETVYDIHGLALVPFARILLGLLVYLVHQLYAHLIRYRQWANRHPCHPACILYQWRHHPFCQQFKPFKNIGGEHP